MDFEKLYKKYKDGTATEEEIKLVEEEIKKAKEISSILDEKTEDFAEDAKTPKDDVFSKVVDSEKFKNALKYFNFKQLLRTVVIVCAVFLLLVTLIVGTVAGVVYYNANQAETITKEQAVELAKECVADYAESDGEKLIVKEIDKDVEVKLNPADSRFYYEIEVIDTTGEYTVDVNTETGYAFITDIDSVSKKGNFKGFKKK